MTLQTVTWDECELAQSKAKELVETGIYDTEDEAFQATLCDTDFFQWEYEDFQEYLSGILNAISEDGCFFVEGSNMGWRHRSGTLGLKADNASQFTEKAFPKTNQWTLRGEYDPKTKTLTYCLSHHDAPTGESYTVRQGYPHPADGEILPEKPVIALTVRYWNWNETWMAEDDTGDFTYCHIKADALREARAMRGVWRANGYKTTLTIKNKMEGVRA